MVYLYLFNYLWHYTFKGKWQIVTYFCLHILSQVSIAFQPILLAELFNVLQINPANLIWQVLKWIFAYLATFTVFELFHRTARYFERRIAFNCQENFTLRLYDLVSHFPLEWQTDHHSGSIINRIKTASIALHNFAESQFVYIEYFVMFIGPLIALYLIGKEFLFILIIISFLTLLLCLYIDRCLVLLVRQKNDQFHYFFSGLFDYLSNIKTIITLKLQKNTSSDLRKRYFPLYHIINKILGQNQRKCFLLSAIVTVVPLGLIVLYIIQTFNSGQLIKIGTVSAIFQYSAKLTDTLFKMATQYTDLVKMKTDYDSVSGILNIIKI